MRYTGHKSIYVRHYYERFQNASSVRQREIKSIWSAVWQSADGSIGTFRWIHRTLTTMVTFRSNLFDGQYMWQLSLPIPFCHYYSTGRREIPSILTVKWKNCNSDKSGGATFPPIGCIWGNYFSKIRKDTLSTCLYPGHHLPTLHLVCQRIQFPQPLVLCLSEHVCVCVRVLWGDCSVQSEGWF